MKATVYVDGSYDKNKNLYGYGIVFLIEGKEPEYFNGFGRAKDGQNGWNINGELKAASVAIEKAIEKKITDLTIYHDYEGIGAWPDGRWKTKHDYIRKYVNQVQDARSVSKMKITFIHVKGHSGNKWNEKADQLAKEGILKSGSNTPSKQEITKRAASSKAEQIASDQKRVLKDDDDFDLPDGLTAVGAASIRKFLSSPNIGDSEYRQLKTGGFDHFSSLKKDELEIMLGTITCEKIKKRINNPYKYEAALRWCARGLSIEQAVGKTNFDDQAYKN